MEHYRPYGFNVEESRSLAESDVVPPTGHRAFKYRAFISYSHADTRWARSLHRSLENFRIDKDLAGRKTPLGPVPKTLRPIFRDRDDFSAGNSLTEQTLAALESSQFLIVICSPRSARSQYVNEEIRRFKALSDNSNVLPIIIDGQPGDGALECFPPALRFRVDQNGELTGEREEPIAADARKRGDGKQAAREKIIAGLLGVGLDEIVRRAKRARRRRNLFYAGLGAAILMLVAAAAYGWWAEKVLDGALTISDDLSWARDASDICENDAVSINDQKIKENKRIAFVFECVDTFDDLLDEVPRDRPIPKQVAISFKTYLAAMKTFQTAHKLTSAQMDLLNKAQILAKQFHLL